VLTGYSWATNPASQWINFYDGTGYATNATDSYSVSLSREFRTCSADSLTLTFQISNDNFIGSLNIDGGPSLFSQPPVFTLTNFTTFTNFTTTIYVTSGTHSLNVVVGNVAAAIPMNAHGLNIVGTIASASGASSIVRENDASCASYVCSSIACNTIALPDTLTACAGSTVTLAATITGPDSVLSIAWSPATGLSDSAIASPTLTVSSSGYYYVTVTSLLPGNLVVNGDFSAGNTGFTSDYTYSPPPSTVLAEGDYSVSNDPHNVHAGFLSFPDHTSGTGNMLIMNGGPSPVDVWCQTIAVAPGTYYDFSAWFADCSSVTVAPYQPILQFQINGSLIGAPYTVSASPGTWMNFYSTWYSGTSTTATICIYDELTAAAGNDFVIDDISFSPICLATDSIYVNAIAADTTKSATDTSACAVPGSILLSGPAGYSSYVWNTGSTVNTITVSAAGTYWVSVTGPCVLHVDTFHVSFTAPTQTSHILSDSMCTGASLSLNGPAGSSSYTWSDGSTSSSISVSNSGTYWSSGAAGCSVTTDTFHVAELPLPSVSLGNDTSVCEGTDLVVAANESAGVTNLWSNGETSNAIIVNSAGQYVLTVDQNGCTNTDTINIGMMYPPTLNLGPDTSLCNGDYYMISAPAGESVIWSTGKVANSITVNETGAYWGKIVNQCGVAVDTVNVDIGPCDVATPDAFSPNNDGSNDVFYVRGTGIVEMDFRVYNRWGQLVFESKDVKYGWDGTYKGEPQPVDIYAYSLEVRLLDGTTKKLKGNITLLR